MSGVESFSELNGQPCRVPEMEFLRSGSSESCAAVCACAGFKVGLEGRMGSCAGSCAKCMMKLYRYGSAWRAVKLGNSFELRGALHDCEFPQPRKELHRILFVRRAVQSTPELLGGLSGPLYTCGVHERVGELFRAEWTAVQGS